MKKKETHIQTERTYARASEWMRELMMLMPKRDVKISKKVNSWKIKRWKDGRAQALLKFKINKCIERNEIETSVQRIRATRQRIVRSKISKTEEQKRIYRESQLRETKSE